MNNDEKYNAILKSMSEYTYDWKPENYDDPTEPILKISKSSLGSFDWCLLIRIFDVAIIALAFFGLLLSMKTIIG